MLYDYMISRNGCRWWGGSLEVMGSRGCRFRLEFFSGWLFFGIYGGVIDSFGSVIR